MKDKTGYLYLSAKKKQDKTIIDDIYFYDQLKVIKPLYLDDSGQPSIFVVNPGGGYVDGDTYRMDIRLQENAELLLSNQSATTIYKTPESCVCQEMEIVLKKGSLLEYVPDPIIAFKDAKFRQDTKIYMEPGATLIYAELISPGWSPDGTPFTYDTLRLKTEVYWDGKLAVYDQVRLQPDIQNMYETGFFEGYTHFGSMMVIGDQAAPAFLDQMYDFLEDENLPGRIGFSMLTIPGFTLRVFASSTQDAEGVFNKVHTLIRKEWFNKEPIYLYKY
ncbi:urease accessory protein [Scopulibacillus daqui]|uniref:Urease accessory protein UreD n=1 Tax=Scopulibacillus daqui TaxID=1469162 RepID=A0ABS2Q2I7_9BACL|nr:urease accessory protein [Scopulibacillus daqui]